MSADDVTWLTQNAFDRLQAELGERSSDRRAEITKRIELARDEGDLKENGGYHADQELIRTGVRSKVCPVWVIVRPKQLDEDTDRK